MPRTSNSLLIQDDDYYQNKKQLIQSTPGSQYDKFQQKMFENNHQYSVDIQDNKSASKLSLLFGMLVETISIDSELINNKLEKQELKNLEATIQQLIESALYNHFSNILKAFSKDDTLYSLASKVSLKDYARIVCDRLDSSNYWHFINKIIELNFDSLIDPEEKVYILDDNFARINQVTIKDQISVYHFLANLEKYISEVDLEELRK